MGKYEYREGTNYSEQFEAESLEQAIARAKELLRNGDWPVEPGHELHAVLAELDEDGDQVQAHRVTAIYGE